MKILTLLFILVMTSVTLNAQTHLPDTPLKRTKYTMQKFTEYSQLAKETAVAAAKIFQDYYTNIEGINLATLKEKTIREKFEALNASLQHDISAVLDPNQNRYWLNNIWPSILDDIQKN